MATAQNSIKVQIRTQSGAKVVDLPLERYVAAVLAGESSIFQSPEALKAMAVAARTYAVRLRGRHSVEGFDFCDTTHCQRIELDGIGARPRIRSCRRNHGANYCGTRASRAFTPYTRDCGGPHRRRGRHLARSRRALSQEPRRSLLRTPRFFVLAVELRS